jgi:tryptophan synthase beta chain
MGLFYPYIATENVRLIGVEAAGHGLESGKHAGDVMRGQARCAARQPYLPHAGRQRPDIEDAFDLRRTRLSRCRPEHAWLKDSGRAEYVAVTDDEALEAFHQLVPARGHNPGARVEPCLGLRVENGAAHEA